jgi:hypothetical protein
MDCYQYSEDVNSDYGKRITEEELNAYSLPDGPKFECKLPEDHFIQQFIKYPTFRINTPIHNIFCSPFRVALGLSPEYRSALSVG